MLELFDVQNFMSNLQFDKLTHQMSEFLTHLLKPLTDEKFIKQFKRDKINELSITVGNLFRAGMIKYIEQNFNNEELNDHIKEKSQKISNIISKFISDLLNKQILFPKSHEKYHDEHIGQHIFSAYDYLPETKSLMHLLHNLKNYGIQWYDLHSSNLMERPGTKEIVISDLGLFRML